GKKPPSSKRTEGWKPGDRVPASWLNWFWFSTVNSLREIAQAFVSHRESTSGVHGVPEGKTIATARYVDGRLDAHIADKNNPHGVTKAQVGLGSVENYGVAAQAEAEAGTVNNKYMTPLRTKQAIDALAVGNLEAHFADKTNPHGVTKAQVGLGSVENYGVATQAEAEAGTVNNKYKTPLRTKQAIDALAVVYPVPVTSLKRANGTMSGSSVGGVFAVH